LQENSTLVIEHGEISTAISILEMVAKHYNTTPAKYCEEMRNPNTWGGGPEIVGDFLSQMIE
jgi:hypothetical protein